MFLLTVSAVHLQITTITNNNNNDNNIKNLLIIVFLIVIILTDWIKLPLQKWTGEMWTRMLILCINKI